MTAIRRKTREERRHERATVLQQLGEVSASQLPANDWLRQRAIEVSRMKRAQTRAAKPACDKCNDQAGGCWYCGRG
jgi:hypothetical protein